MTTNNQSNAPMSTTRVSPADIERVDAFARKLYKRARAADPDLEEIATTVRSLHTVLKHLKFEAEDPESLLSVEDSAVYARQLTPILEDSEFALKQLNTILEKKYGGSGSDADGAAQMDGEKGWMMLESRDRDMIDLIRTKLGNQKLSIDMFLDTIQLHNPSKSRLMVDTSSASLDSIKDKVDAIATRICQRKNSNLVDGNEEELWASFRDELEREGFSRDILRKNQDVIRAYIRQLDEQLSANGGSTPTVRGLLKHYHPPEDGLQIAPYPTYPISGDASPEEMNPSIDEEKLFPSSRMKRLQEDDKRRALPSMPEHPTFLSYDRHSSSGDDDDESMALMSTRELMALDRRAADLAIRMGNMQLQPTLPPDAAGANYHISNSPNQHYLPPSVSQPVLPSSTQDSVAHPRYAPPLPYEGSSPPSAPHSNSLSFPVVSQQQQQQQQQALIVASQRNARLAPDSHGLDIPLDAKWTRIPRRLVSPEVLASAGVRYEARPDFVAILGELTRDEVVDFARRTTQVRNARRRRSSAAIASGPGTKERRADDRYHPDKYRNWDVIEEQQRRRDRGDYRNDHDIEDSDPVIYVANSHRRRRGSTASTVSELYDSDSDSEGMSESERDRELYSQSFPRSSSYLEDYHQSRTPSHPRRSSTTPSASSKPDDKTKSRTRSRADSDAIDGADSNKKGKGTKAYPFIVPAPSSTNEGTKGKSKARDDAGASPAATVMPKSILKNKNDDPHVRIDPTPQILNESSSSLPRNLPSYRRSERERRDRDRERDKDKDRTRDKDRERDRDRDRDKRYRSDRYLDKDRERDRDRDRHREKEYHPRGQDGKDRDSKEEHSHRHHSRSRSRRYHGSSIGGANSASNGARRDRDRDRDREYHDDHYVSTNNRVKEDRSSTKKAKNETLRAVGLGGAAAAMLSMLSEAAL
ncbi:hypothetical protein F4818DRAFT_95367 [Hypoxylon cercidicola]|nr:hypothetical protein F4818DRAFT_95367 [Hypoxylon cercidicola]